MRTLVADAKPKLDKDDGKTVGQVLQKFKENQNVLFWHTGGQVGLFA